MTRTSLRDGISGTLTRVLTALVASIVMPAGTTRAAHTFQALGHLPDRADSYAMGVSDDGSVAVGLGNSSPALPTLTNNDQAFRWTSGGMVGLGFLPGDDLSLATDVSGDGGTIVGSSRTGIDFHAFVWTSGGGMVGLGGLSGASSASRALGISRDGSVVVGTSTTAGGSSEAFRWTSDGMVGLGFLPGDSTSEAQAASGDGAVVVGFSASSAGHFEAARWIGGGIAGLGYLAGGDFSLATSVSGDGSVVVGYGNSTLTADYEAFRWTAEQGMVRLGPLPGGDPISFARDVSADGSVIVGGVQVDGEDRAFLWTSGGGMELLQDVLIASGAQGLAGWLLSDAFAISADGRTIVGYGINPLGQREAWLATVPEPGTGALAFVAAALWWGHGATGWRATARRERPRSRR